MSIKDWPSAERPREKLLAKGPQTLSDAEILAIFIRTGYHGKTAVDIARELLNQFGGLRILLNSAPNVFCSIPGLGITKYVQLQAALELGKRYLQEQLHRDDILVNSMLTKKFLSAKMRDHSREVFACLFLDSKNRVICFEEIFYGSLTSAQVHPREVVKRALYHNAANVIFAHNHPSGAAEPSDSDKHITTLLQDALQLIQITVLDHIVIGDGMSISFAERGWL